MTEALRQPEGLDVTRPSPARIYDYMLRGSHHFAADAVAAERLLTVVPEIRDCAWSNRGFHQRAAAWIAKQGVRQFLDIGSGLPTVGNTHEVVRKIHSDARVVYVDNDPMVELHSKDILDESGQVSVLHADLREPDSILDHPAVRELIDPGEPTGLLMTAVLMFVSDSADPWSLVARFVRAMRSGSYLSLSHLTDDAKPPLAVDAFRRVFDRATEQMHFRSRTQIARFFDGLEIVPPYAGAPSALTYSGLWGAEDVQLADSDGSRWLYCAVARKPLSPQPSQGGCHQADTGGTGHRPGRAGLGAVRCRRRLDRDRLSAQPPVGPRRLGADARGRRSGRPDPGVRQERVGVLHRRSQERRV
jgi:S-adenosyl methyltransferase